MHRRLLPLALTLLTTLCPALASAADVQPAGALAHIAAILKERCYGCHSHSEGTMEGNLTLDAATGWLQGGDSGPALVAGDPDKSLLVKAIRYQDQTLQMPPNGKLPAEEITAVVNWIKAGASDPAPGIKPTAKRNLRDWWAFKPLTLTAVPSAHGDHPVDAFVRDRLGEKGLKPAPKADRRTLIRRLYLDLTGLLPTPDQVAAFEQDPSPTAYEELIDQLLASPRYGEQWARHWLDVAHYADTHGNDHDFHRPNAWPYRDYVIQSLNADKPYARFVAEQVAGDVLYPHDPQATVALGFLAAGPWDHTLLSTIREDTVDHALARYLDRDNMLSTVFSSFQSLTVHCARCHNHKFDPISQREYYGLQAVFAGVDRADRPYERDTESQKRRNELLAQQEMLRSRDLAALAKLINLESSPKLAQIEERIAQRTTDWKTLEIEEIQTEGDPSVTFTKQDDGSWLVGGTTPPRETFVVTAQTNHRVRAIRLETMADPRLPGHGPGRYETGNFHLTEFRVFAGPADAESALGEVKFSKAAADHDETGYAITGSIDSKPETWWGVHPAYGRSHEGVFELEQPIVHEAGSKLIFRLEHNGMDRHQIGRFRLSLCTDEVPVERRVPAPAALTDVMQGPLTTAEQRRAAALHVLAIEREADIAKQLASLDAQPKKMVYAATRDFQTEGSFKPSSSPRAIHLLVRGNINKPGELIAPGTLSCITEYSSTLAIANPDEEGQRRAALANWLSDCDNAITWRSIVNRVWHYHFGRGICDTPNDFGHMGGTPSHPELLEWLAIWFRDDAEGSLKSLHRLILTSETYQQVVVDSPAAAQIDADNRLLWRMNRARLSAEQFRDSLLQLSDQLDLQMGGPPVLQFSDRGAATFKPADGSPPYVDYEGFSVDASAHRRRSVYRFLFRTVPDPLMDALDCPDGGAMTPVRTMSSGAPQALALMNNGLVIRQCEKIAEAAVRRRTTLEEQVMLVFEQALLRSPKPSEFQAVAAYARKYGLANACQVLINTNEFLYVD